MADDNTSAATSVSSASTASPALQAAQSQMTQILGKLVDNINSQGGDQSAGLNAILAAIQAKPSA